MRAAAAIDSWRDRSVEQRARRGVLRREGPSVHRDRRGRRATLNAVASADSHCAAASQRAFRFLRLRDFLRAQPGQLEVPADGLYTFSPVRHLEAFSAATAGKA